MPSIPGGVRGLRGIPGIDLADALANRGQRHQFGSMPRPRGTPVTFTREHARQIREAMGKSRTGVACPQCGEMLTVSEPVSREGSLGVSFEVRCEPCQRVAIITEVPGTRRPE